MNKKIFIILIILSLSLFIGTCTLDQKEEPCTSISEKIQTDLTKQYFSEDCIVILEKNWSTQEKDSFLLSNRLMEIPIILAEEESIIFINKKKDTIEYIQSQIHSHNAIVIFSKAKGPILTALDQFNQTYSFFFPQVQKELPKAIEAEDIRVSEIIKTMIKEYHKPRYTDLSYLNAISNKEVFYDSPPASIQEINNTVPNDRISSYPLLNENHVLTVRFDNDFWDYTDYYYTNGIGIGFTHPVLASSPISRILVSNGTNGIDYYGIHLDQRMYTSTKPKVDSIIKGDRPWASYSMLGQFLYSFDRRNKIRHYSEFNIGIIGPESGGGFLQNLVHTVLPNNSPPQGWDHQIKTDIIIDYVYEIQKILYETNKFESYTKGGAEVGTLKDHISWGFGLRYGSFISLYQDFSNYHRNRTTAPFSKKLRFNVVLDIQTSLIGYDATLQGGVTDRTSIYVIPTTQMERFVMEGFGGFETSYGRIHLQFLQFWKSKKFTTGRDHKYISIRLHYSF